MRVRPTKKSEIKHYSEGYRLGLYAGGKLARIGIELPEPPEAKEDEEGSHADIQGCRASQGSY